MEQIIVACLQMSVRIPPEPVPGFTSTPDRLGWRSESVSLSCEHLDVRVRVSPITVDWETVEQELLEDNIDSFDGVFAFLFFRYTCTEK